MRIKLLTAKTAVLDKLNSQTWPAGWAGDIADDIVKSWPAADYEILPVAPVAPVPGVIPAAALTPKQVAILAAAADDAERMVASGEGIVEPTVEPVVETDEVDLNAMTATELRAVAKQVGIPGTKAMTKAELVAALEARRA
jgi:hypothetical protein